MGAIETRNGRRLAWLGYLTIVVSVAGWVAVNWSRSGDTPAILAVVGMIGLWAGSAGVAYHSTVALVLSAADEDDGR